MARMLLAALAMLMVTAVGCLMPRADSRLIHMYQLSLDAWSGELENRPADPAKPILLVGLPQPDAGVYTQRMVFLTRRFELEYYGMNQWTDTPARMIAPLLVETLSRKGGWRAVVPAPASIRGDYRLDTFGLILQQEFLQHPSRVRLGGRVQLTDLKESRILGTRTFEVLEDVSSEDAYGGVLAANRAVARWLDQIGTWVRDCLDQGGGCAP